MTKAHTHSVVLIRYIASKKTLGLSRAYPPFSNYERSNYKES